LNIEKFLKLNKIKNKEVKAETKNSEDKKWT
jgi:hypothetical protein